MDIADHYKIKNGTQIQSFPEATAGSNDGDGGNTDCNGQMVMSREGTEQWPMRD